MVPDSHISIHIISDIQTQNKCLSFLFLLTQNWKMNIMKQSFHGIADIRERIIDNLKDDRKVRVLNFSIVSVQ